MTPEHTALVCRLQVVQCAVLAVPAKFELGTSASLRSLDNDLTNRKRHLRHSGDPGLAG